jgi:hypothetical protein
MTLHQQQPASAPAPVRTLAEADELARHFAEVLDGLAGVMQQETDLVRAGQVAAATKLAQPKADLTRLYIADTLRLRANRSQMANIAPDVMARLRRQHDGLRGLLKVNLMVLATAHAVSEGIVRGVSSELNRKSSPQTYGATGRTVAPSRNAGQPLAVSRSL